MNIFHFRQQSVSHRNSFLNYRLSLLLWLYFASFLALLLALGLPIPQNVRAFSSMTVTSTADGTLAALNGNGTCDLREAIQAANTNTTVGECPAGQAGPTVDVINFNIGTGVQTINLTAPLPTITDPVLIDGTTQPGWVAAQTPQIVLNGTSAGTGANGLTIASGGSGSTVQALVINNFPNIGIYLQGSNNNVIIGNYLGTNAAGNAAQANGADGVFMDSSSKNNRVGTNGDGTNDAIEKNLISGNTRFGVGILGSGTSGNIVAGNLIGLRADGTAKIANGSNGIQIAQGAASNRIGTDGSNDAFNANERNIISGNDGPNILISDTGSDNNVVAGNYIGTNATGTAAVPGLNVGMVIQQGAKNTRVGTNADGVADTEERNLVSGNAGYGVFIQGTGTTGTAVAGNYIGLNANGDAAIGNQNEGVVIAAGATNNRIGTTGDGSVNDSHRRNVISGNTNSGVRIVNSGSNNNNVAGNYIGTNAAGTAALPNTVYGVYLVDQVQNNIIGTTGVSANPAGERNVISGNANSGVMIDGINLPGTNTGNVIAGNFIGTNATGFGGIPNSSGGGAGVSIINQANNNTIGGPLSVEGNKIFLNTGFGISVDAPNNTIQDNNIAANGTGGISITGSGNLVGTNSDSVNDATEANFISNNTGSGILITGVAATNNTVAGNVIGETNSFIPSGNNGAGISIGQGASSNLIGGSGNLAANLIAFNTGPGVALTDSTTTGNRISRNSILSNTGIGIDLGNDGVTPNGSSGLPNNSQNYSVLATAQIGENSILLEGSLTSAPGSFFTLEFFVSQNCSTRNGQTYLGTINSFGIDDSGTGSFSQSFTANVAEGQFITATATNTAGSTSEFSACLAASSAVGNTTWANATPLTFTPAGGGVSNATATALLTQPDGSVWYKFDALPGSQIFVFLTGATASNLPANYDISLHRDLEQAYSQLNNPNASTTSITQVAANTLPSGLLPSGLLPSGLLPSGLLPSGLLPSGLLPSGLLPSGLLPSGLLPSGLLPSGLLPSGLLTSELLTPEYLVSQFLNTESVVPSGRNAAAYNGAVLNSLLAVSANGGLTPEYLARNSWERGGTFYIRIKSRDGSVSLTDQVRLQVTTVNGVCGTVPAVSGAFVGADPAQVNQYKTLILTDSSLVQGANGALAPTERQNLLAKLNQLAARPEVNGLVVDLGENNNGVFKYPRLHGSPTSANDIAQSKIDCPFAKNLVASEIKAIINSYDQPGGNPRKLEYIVLVGSDNSLPFVRYPDLAGKGSEITYTPQVLSDSASNAALQNNLFLSQDAYGTNQVFIYKDIVLPLPDLAVGRLVENAGEIITMIDAYLKLPGGVTTPKSGLVTGYDFVSDAAQAVLGEFQGGINQNNCPNVTNCVDQLINAQTVRPTDSAAWSADDLRQKLLSQRNDLIFLAGHFSDHYADAAKIDSRIGANELLNSLTDLTNSIFISIGCHSGYNIPRPDQPTNATEVPDWAQALAAKGMTAVIGTGFQYGDYEVVDYSERLYLELARQLRTGQAGTNGKTTVALGKALVEAKKRYLSTTAEIDGMHEKVTLIATLYGLPMFSVSLTPTPPASDGSNVSPTAVGGNPYSLSTASFALQAPNQSLNLTPVAQTLTNTDTNASVDTLYFKGSDGTVANQHQPILPLEIRNVQANGTVLRGVGLRNATYSDNLNKAALTSVPVTELGQPRTFFGSTVFYPSQPWSVNYLDALSSTTTGKTLLLATPAQYKSNPLDPNTGTLPVTGTVRQYQTMNFQLYYSSYTGPEAVATGPRILSVSAVPDPAPNSANRVKFTVKIAKDPAFPNSNTGGVQTVWITFTGLSGDTYGKWISPANDLSLSDVQPDDPAVSQWEWYDSLPVGNTPLDQVVFMVQAANQVGVITLDTNAGDYYPIKVPVTPPPPPTQRNTILQFVDGSGNPIESLSAAYLSQPPAITARLSYLDANNNPVALANEPVTLEIGGQIRQVTTNAEGKAIVNGPGSSITVKILQTPGSNISLTANYAGNLAAGYLPSAGVVQLTVTRPESSLTITPTTAVQLVYGAPSGIEALLTEKATGKPLSDRTVYFVATNQQAGQPSYYLPVQTDFDGRARLGAPRWMSGSYSVKAYFNGEIPLPVVGTITADDLIYQAAVSEQASVTTTQGSSQTSLTSLPNPALQGSNVTFTAKVIPVAPATGIATGLVTFKQDGALLGRASLNEDGLAVFTTNSLALGQSLITAEYAGDANFTASVSNSLTQLVVTGGPPVTTATLSTPANANGWHRQNVTVTLKATDNSGTGIKQINYSATPDPDKGGQAIAPSVALSDTVQLVISTEGITTLSFYATDNTGVVESPAKTLVVRLDKTAPELDLYFEASVQNRGLKLKTVDKLSGAKTALIDLPVTSVGIRTYILEDLAGNSLELTLNNISQQKDSFVGVEFRKLVYNAANAVPTLDLLEPYSENTLKVEYTPEPNQPIKTANQQFKLNKVFQVQANYKANKNTTDIQIKVPDKPDVKRTDQGFVLLHAVSNKGKLEYLLVS